MSSWVARNNYLSMSEMKQNANNVYAYARSYGWTDEACAAILGNMQAESGINPGIWENLEAYAGGYGLVQWTPYTKYSNWAGVGWQNNGDKQMARIKYELDNGLQWDSNRQGHVPAAYQMTFDDFVHSHLGSDYLAKVWLWCYEYPADTASKEAERAANAIYWYTYITGEEPPEPPEPQPGNVPIWLLFKFKEGRWC